MGRRWCAQESLLVDCGELGVKKETRRGGRRGEVSVRHVGRLRLNHVLEVFERPDLDKPAGPGRG